MADMGTTWVDGSGMWVLEGDTPRLLTQEEVTAYYEGLNRAASLKSSVESLSNPNAQYIAPSGQAYAHQQDVATGEVETVQVVKTEER